MKRGSITRCIPSFLKSGRTQKASAGFDGTGKPLNILSVMDLRQYMRSWLFKNVKKKKKQQQQQKRFSTHRIFLSALLLKCSSAGHETGYSMKPILHCLRLLMPSLVNLLNFMSMRPKYRISRFPIFFLRRYIPQGYPTIDTFSVQHA